MKAYLVRCLYCGWQFPKDHGYIYQITKFDHIFYRCFQCGGRPKTGREDLSCENTNCRKKFDRISSDISPHNYCSRSCAATINNTKFPKRIAIIRRCSYCHNRLFKYGRVYCSVKCRGKALAITKEKIINQIKNFFEIYKRIPLKREFNHYNAARDRFGTWNKTIEAAGFKPNPVMFADKCFANDGHICDSVAEKIIDDYLYERGINHLRNYLYPEGGYIADFKIGNKIVEYFGLAGEHRGYDKIRKVKQNIAKKFDLQLIEIYPQDLYPKGSLNKILMAKLNTYTYGVEAKLYLLK